MNFYCSPWFSICSRENKGGSFIYLPKIKQSITEKTYLPDSLQNSKILFREPAFMGSSKIKGIEWSFSFDLKWLLAVHPVKSNQEIFFLYTPRNRGNLSWQKMVYHHSHWNQTWVSCRFYDPSQFSLLISLSIFKFSSNLTTVLLMPSMKTIS